MDAIKKDMKVAGVNEEDAMDHEKWKKWSVVATPSEKSRKKNKQKIKQYLNNKYQIVFNQKEIGPGKGKIQGSVSHLFQAVY